MTGRKTAARGNKSRSASVARSQIRTNDLAGDKQAKALKILEAQYHDLYENAPDMYLSTNPVTGHVIRCNQTYLNATGYTRDEVIGQPVSGIFQPECQAAARQASKQFIATGRLQNLEMLLKRKDGGALPISLNSSAVRDSQGRILHSRSILRDITAHKRTEEALRKSEERFRALTNFSPDIISVFDSEGRLIFNSAAAVKIHGYQPADLEGRSTFDFIHPDDRLRVTDAFGSLLKNPTKTVEVQYRYRHADGSYNWMEAFGTNELANPHINGIIAISRDITARKNTEVKLVETTERLSLAQQAGQVGVFDWNLTTNEAVWTPELEDIFGLPSGGFEKNYGGWRKRVYPEDLPRIETMFARWLKSKKNKAQWEYRYLRHGELRWISARGQVFRDGRGQPLRMIGTNLDVTNLKRAEAKASQLTQTLEQRVAERTDKLKESEAKFSVAFKCSPTPMNISRFDDGLIVDANDAFLATTGLTRKEVINSNIKTLGIWVDPKIRAQAVKQLIHHVEVKDIEFHFQKKNGGIGTGLFSAHLIHFNNVPHILSAANDITDRKQAAASLKHSEARFRQIAANIEDVLYGVDSQSREFNYMSPVFERLLGYTLADVARLGGREKFLAEVIQHGQFEKQRAMFGQLQTTPIDTPLRWQAWWRCKDGSLKYIEDLALPFYFEGKLQYTYGALRDNTERVRLEQEILNISDWERRRIAQDLHDGLGQILVGAGFLADTLHRDLAGKLDPAVRQIIQIQKEINAATKQARDLARDVQPVEPEPNGLMTALAKLANQMEEIFHIRCDFKCRQPVGIQIHQTATHLFRIAQEAVTNAIKHGKPKRILIRLTRTPKQITLTVNDNGLGMTDGAQKKTGMGMNIMRYRAGIIGGALTIRHGSAGGVIVACAVLVPEE